jgi:hypothetical protein
VADAPTGDDAIRRRARAAELAADPEDVPTVYPVTASAALRSAAQGCCAMSHSAAGAGLEAEK